MLKYDFGDGVAGFSTETGDLIDYEIIVPVYQAHGTKVSVIRNSSIIPDTNGVDAIVTNVKGLTIGVKTADCVPILIYDSSQKVIAAIHSGWKGTIANITGCVIEIMRKEFDSSPTDIKAVIGPCIHVESFEVGDEVYLEFKNKGYGHFCRRMYMPNCSGDEKWHVDLPSVCRHQLLDRGITDIELRNECTYRQFPRFYSARRMKEELGNNRMLNCICL